MRKVKVQEMVDALELDVIWGNDFLDRKITKPMLSRPSLEIYAGYFDFFEKDRVQIIGSKELTIFKKLTKEQQTQRLEELFAFNSPVYVFTRGAEAPKEFVTIAIKKQIPLLRSSLSTSALIGNMTAYLSNQLAERVNVAGSMVDLYGVGVLIIGENGIGKSETALELIKRGHILISDDETRVYQREPGMLICESPKVSAKLMKIKDIGMVNVTNLFGIGSYRHKKRLMLVVELVRSLGENTDQSTTTFFETDIPKITVVVESNRNIASLIEAAALNNRLKNMGQSGEEEYATRVIDDTIRRVK